jgi:pimeloyl-ACP methyl ester carboxylesterase
MSDYATGSTTSKDGTTIGFRRLGSGPAIVLVHGGMQAAQSLMPLANRLAGEFELFVVDRRGRGMSGPLHDGDGISQEIQDLQSVVELSGATRVFGLSAGALISLRTAAETPAITKLAAYEPPLSINGSVPTQWLPRFDSEVDAGKSGQAVITALKGLGTEPMFARIPRWMLAPLLPFSSARRSKDPNDVAIFDLVQLEHADIMLVRELADAVDVYTDVRADTLLMTGSKSPSYFGVALDALEPALPHSRRVVFEGLGHSGAEDDGDPERVAVKLRKFFG